MIRGRKRGGRFMRFLKALSLTSLFCTALLQADGIGIGIGPFDLEINTSPGPYVYEYRTVLDNPICYAISNQKRLEMNVSGVEKVSDKEIRIVTKRLVVEPYAFAMTTAGKPLLRGKIVEEKEMKRVSVKYGEPEYSEMNLSSEDKEKGFFSGWFRSDKSQTIDIRKMSDLRVIENSHFDLPKGYKGFRDENVRVICEIPTGG